jgi:hypothetical protein
LPHRDNWSVPNSTKSKDHEIQSEKFKNLEKEIQRLERKLTEEIKTSEQIEQEKYDYQERCSYTNRKMREAELIREKELMTHSQEEKRLRNELDLLVRKAREDKEKLRLEEKKNKDANDALLKKARDEREKITLDLQKDAERIRKQNEQLQNELQAQKDRNLELQLRQERMIQEESQFRHRSSKKAKLNKDDISSIDSNGSHHSIRSQHMPVAAKKANFFESWILHTSELSKTAFSMEGTETEATRKWKNSTKMASSTIREYHLIILLVEHSRRGGECAHADLDPPTYSRIANEDYASALFIITSINLVKNVFQAQFIGLVHEKMGSRIQSLELTIKRNSSASIIPESFLVPCNRSMGGLINRDLMLKIHPHAVPLDNLIDNEYLNTSALNTTVDLSKRAKTSNTQPGANDITFELQTNNTVFFDLNNRQYAEQLMKVPQKGIKDLEEVGIVARQFRDEAGRCARLGNVNKTFIDYTTFSHNVTTSDQHNNLVLLSKLGKIFSSPEKFKSAVLWHWGIPNGLSLNDFTDETITSNTILISAIQNLGRFLMLTFGDHWDRRIDEFVTTISFVPHVHILQTPFIQYTFEVSCSYMYNAIRTQSPINNPSVVQPSSDLLGEHFAKLFQDFISPKKLTFVNQLTWEALFVNRVPTTPLNNLSIKKRESADSSTAKQICFPFLRHFLGIDSQSCNNTNCPRVHEDIATWRKEAIVSGVSMAPRSNELVTAINSSNLFL